MKLFSGDGRSIKELTLWLSLGLNAALLVGIVILATGQAQQAFDRLLIRAAPGMPPFPPDLSFLADRLDLDAEQKVKVEAIFDRAKENAVGEFEVLKNMRLKVVSQIITNPEDEAGLDRVLEDGSELPKAFAKKMLGYLREVVLVLNQEQREKLLKEIESFEGREMIVIKKQADLE